MLSAEKKFIQCQELREQILGSIQGVLVLDIRPKEDFLKSVIANVNCVNIPESHIMPGCVCVLYLKLTAVLGALCLCFITPD